MGVFDRAITTSLRLITKYGAPVTWLSTPGAVTPDPSQPWIVVPGEPASFDTSILFKSEQDSALWKLVLGSEVSSGGEKAIMPAGLFTPQVTDSVVMKDGTKLALESVRPLAPNGIPIMWFLVFKS